MSCQISDKEEKEEGQMEKSRRGVKGERRTMELGKDIT